MAHRIHRRTFLHGTGAAGLGLFAGGPRVLRLPRREKLNIACFGVGGRGWGNVRGVAGENLVAFCDVDLERAKAARERYPDVPLYADYRELLDELGDTLDAVTVSTPDHMHAPIALNAMARGIHCYCEKPLTWSVWEAREMARLAKEQGLATQMGNQGTASDGFREGVEFLRTGGLGEVSEVHVWTNRPVWPQALATPTERPAVPEHLSWDEWVGVAPERAYHPAYLPFKWRGWYDFGAGALGDMACHTVNLAYMGLELGAPTRITAESTELFQDTFPAGSRITFDFPERGDGKRPAVKLTWYDGSMRPPADILGGKEVPGSGCLIIGERGRMFSRDDYGAKQSLEMDLNRGLIEAMSRVEPSLPRSPGHHQEWLAACRGEGQTLSNFGHAGPFTEAILLGNLAVRLGKPIDWDAENLKAKGLPEADPLIRREYR